MKFASIFKIIVEIFIEKITRLPHLISEYKRSAFLNVKETIFVSRVGKGTTSMFSSDSPSDHSDNTESSRYSADRQNKRKRQLPRHLTDYEMCV